MAREDRRPCEGLAAHERRLHEGSLEAGHIWFTLNTLPDFTSGVLFSAYGR